MASKKKQFEGIAMLSMYNDEEEEEEEEEEGMEDVVEQEEQRPEDEKAERQESVREQQDDDYRDSIMTEQEDLMAIDERIIGGDSANDDTPPIDNESTMPRLPVSVVSPQQEAALSGSSRMSRKGQLTIVDYGHDEVAMSPEPEVLPLFFSSFFIQTVFSCHETLGNGNRIQYIMFL